MKPERDQRHLFQTQNVLGAQSNGFDWGGRGPSNVIAFPNIYQLLNSTASSVISSIYSSLGTWAVSQGTNALSTSALQQIYDVQTDLIVNHNGNYQPSFAFASDPDSPAV